MLSETVVIEGEVSLVSQIDGDPSLLSAVDGDPDVVIAEGMSPTYPHYSGSYIVTPSSSVQTLDTSDKIMDDDVTIEAVPQGSATTPATIITADPTISVSNGGLITATVSKTQQITPTVQEGYVEEGTPGNVGVSGSNTEQLSVQGAQTLYPATVDQTIPTHKYTTGVQTFKAVTVSGLTADKVLQGNTVEIGDADDSDRIMKVVGTASGGITPTGTKQISIASNGTVTEDVTNYANAEITTNVPASAVDTGTKSINSNGTHDVVGYASASVNVPNSYSQSDEGKVVSNGALVAQTSDTVTANDTYDTTLINSLTVNVSGGGGSNLENEILSGTLSGAYTNNTVTTLKPNAFADTPQLTSVSLPSVTSAGNSALRSLTNLESINMPSLASIGAYVFYGCSKLNNVSLPQLGTINNNAFENCTGLTSVNFPLVTQINNSGLRNCRFSTIVLPKVTKIDTYGLSNNPNLTAVDFSALTQLTGGSGFINDSSLNAVVIRTGSVATLSNINHFNGTPFASGGTGGTLYVPQALISSYQSATNWSTILGYANNSIQKIEGSIYE